MGSFQIKSCTTLFASLLLGIGLGACGPNGSSLDGQFSRMPVSRSSSSLPNSVASQNPLPEQIQVQVRVSQDSALADPVFRFSDTENHTLFVAKFSQMMDCRLEGLGRNNEAAEVCHPASISLPESFQRTDYVLAGCQDVFAEFVDQVTIQWNLPLNLIRNLYASDQSTSGSGGIAASSVRTSYSQEANAAASNEINSWIAANPLSFRVEVRRQRVRVGGGCQSTGENVSALLPNPEQVWSTEYQLSPEASSRSAVLMHSPSILQLTEPSYLSEGSTWSRQSVTLGADLYRQLRSRM